MLRQPSSLVWSRPGTNRNFLATSARSMARSAADKAAAFVIAWPPRDGPRGLARHAMVRVEGDRPFPYVPPDALNDQVFDVSMFHVI